MRRCRVFYAEPMGHRFTEFDVPEGIDPSDLFYATHCPTMHDITLIELWDESPQDPTDSSEGDCAEERKQRADGMRKEIA